MKILAVADLHYALKQFDWLLAIAPDFDVVFIAGDLLDIASGVGIEAQIIVVRSYLRKLSAATRLVVCSGNHDLDVAGGEGERVAGWLRDLRDIDVVSDGDSFRIGPLQISAFPWWDGPATRSAISRQLQQDAPEDGFPWIWVYHAPPDASPTSWGGKRHFGDPELAAWIRAYQPDIVFCGHVHQAPFIANGAWADRIGRSWVFNTGQQPGEAPAHIIMAPVLGKAMWHSLAGVEELDLRKAGARPESVLVLPEWLRA